MAVTIAGVADLVPGTKYRPLPDSPFFAQLRGATLTVANLEVPLTDRPTPLHEGIVLHSPTVFASEIPKAGVDVASIANNHILGHGEHAVLETIAACTEAGVLTLGYGANRSEASRPLFVPVPGGTIAIVCATSIGPPDSFATVSGPGVSALRVITSRKDDPRLSGNPGSIGIAVTEPLEDDISLLEEQVRAAKAQTTAVVVVLHWGLGNTVLGYMRIAAERLIDAGASLVFGHHTHQFAAVDWYHGAPIFYGLGNFLFQYDGDVPVHVSSDAAAAFVDVDLETGKAQQARMLIGRMDEAGVPWPTTPERVEHVVEEFQRLSAGRNAVISLAEGGCIISPKSA